MAIRDYSNTPDDRVPSWVLESRIARRAQRKKEFKYNTCHCGTDRECLVHNMDRALEELRKGEKQ